MNMKVDHINLMVTSLELSLPYYEKLLPLMGFKRERKNIWTDGDGFYLQFQQAKSGTTPYERYGAGMNHLGFGAGSATQVIAIRQAMLDAGFDVPEVQDLGGVTAPFMKDPDGMRFEVSYYPSGQNVFD